MDFHTSTLSPSTAGNTESTFHWFQLGDHNQAVIQLMVRSKSYKKHPLKLLLPNYASQTYALLFLQKSYLYAMG